MNNKDRKHFFLIEGEVVFRMPDNDMPQSIRMNALTFGDSRNIPVRLIGKAQQALQLQFFQHMNDPKISVINVVIGNMIYMGLMTDAELHEPPKGAELLEVDMPVEGAMN